MRAALVVGALPMLMVVLSCRILPAEEQQRIHLAEGMWSEHWRLDDILGATYRLSDSFLTSRYGFATALKGFPESKADFFENQVLVMANIPVDAFARAGTYRGMHEVKGRSVDWVEEFVKNGGGLLVLSGNYSLGIGDRMRGSSLEQVLPVEIHGDDIDIARQARPFVFQAAGEHPILAGVSFDEHPMTLFYHEVKPKPAATVVVKSGEIPILIVGTYGKGRVAILTATVQGDPQPPDLPYWNWKGWDRLMLNSVAWLDRK